MKTKIYQIFYRNSQKDSLDPDLIPYNNEGKSYPYNFEYAVFFDLYEKTNWNNTDLLGSVSWKFHQKTGLSGQEFLAHISKNPGADVYFVNPFPELCIYRSVWEHGQEFHPNLKKLTVKLFKECGYSDQILKKETPPNLTAYCNYWVANKQFWDSYIEFLTPFWKYVRKDKGPLCLSLKKMADPIINAPYLPFIFERLFSTFLAEHKFKVSSLPIPPSKILDNPYLSPVSNRIIRVRDLNNHKLVLRTDRFAIGFFSIIRKFRHYYLPLIIKKIR